MSDAGIRLSGPLTARTVLFGDVSAAEIGGQLAHEGFFRRGRRKEPGVPDDAWQAIEPRLGEMTADFLDVDLGSIALRGLQLFGELRRTARETLAGAAHREALVPVDVQISSERHPRIEVVLGERQVSCTTLDIDIVLRMSDVTATVRDGSLVTLGGGWAEAEVRLDVAGCEGPPWTSGPFPFAPASVVNLGPGVSLIAAEIPGPRHRRGHHATA